MSIHVQVKRIDPELPLPAYAYPGDAGMDLYSRVDVDLGPGERARVPTGLAVAIPEGYAGFVQPRSGLADRHGLSMVNTPGLIDSHYRGEIAVLLLNTDKREPIHIGRGEKIAQIVFQAVEEAVWAVVGDLEDTVRGEGGFGSSGR
jgi:dUTP pyrophosphatase